MTENALAALKAAYAASSAGEWRLIEPILGGYLVIGDETTVEIDGMSGGDKEFIVAAHTHLPALLAEVEKLRAELTKTLYHPTFRFANGIQCIGWGYSTLEEAKAKADTSLTDVEILQVTGNRIESWGYWDASAEMWQPAEDFRYED